jgi:ATP-dependent RNA helicase DDX31/DBP7
MCSQAFKRIVAGYLMGGEKKKSEKARIRKGLNILVTTPGRLIDHMGSTNNLELTKLKWFIIDEADRLLEQGFEESITKIVDHIKNQCEWKPQTVLLSATLTKPVQRLAGMSLVDPNIIDISDQNMTLDSFVLPQNLSQHYIIVPAKLRLITLSSFIIDKSSLGNFKALIFMSCQDVVDFYYTIFSDILNPLLKKSNIEEVYFFHLHGNMDQFNRNQVFHKFRQSRAGVLICTDVAARGLHLPKVDWIIQFSCAPKSEDYVHRVGRTARIGNIGNSIQFLLTSETKFLETLQKDLNINLYEMDFKECLKSVMLLKFERKIENKEEYATHLQTIYENRISGDSDLLDLAKRAYLSYLRSYASYPKTMTEILPFKELHLGHLAKSFGLQESPKALGAYGFRLKQQSIDLQQKYANYNKKISHITDNSSSNSNREQNKRKFSQMPSEMKVSEFGGQLITKLPTNKKLKKRTHFY